MTPPAQLGNIFPSAQTRTFLSPEEVLKGLQGEIEEVLIGISLSVNVLKELYRAYDFCCANMKLFFKVQPGLRTADEGKEVGVMWTPWHPMDLQFLSLSPRTTRSRCLGNSLLLLPFPE